MRKTYIEIFADDMNDKTFFILIVFIQTIFIFQGFDFADSGFAAEYYSRIFSDPSSGEYNFMFWFTGVIGGLWLKFFPTLGLLGLRMAGILVTTCTCWITYNLLKKFLRIGPLRLSLFLIILFLASSIKEIFYDDVSALFFICAAWFLFSGLTKEKTSQLLIAGAFISVNTFSRLPNIMGISLILAIWFSGYLNRKIIREMIWQSLIFMGGFAIMSVVLIILMKAMHHDVYFLNNLNLVRRMGSSANNSHGLYSMLKLSIVHYGEAISMSIVVFVVLWSLSAAWARLKREWPRVSYFQPIFKGCILIIIAALCIYRAKKDPDFWFYLFLFFAGTSLIVGFIIITGQKSKNLRLLAVIGCIMLLVLPFGSNYVLITVGKYAVWLILPIAINYLLDIQALSSRVIISENNQQVYSNSIDQPDLDGLRGIAIYITLIFILCVAYYYPYFDRSGRYQMRYSINNEHARGIFTTERRARVVNELLSESALYVKPNDYVLAYDCMPMYYYLTDTRPFMHNSWPWLYDDTVFKTELINAIRETNICPVVIMQKRSTLGNNWPDNYDEDYKFKPKTLADMQKLFKDYQYNQVWENDFFQIYVPAYKNPKKESSGQ